MHFTSARSEFEYGKVSRWSGNTRIDTLPEQNNHGIIRSIMEKTGPHVFSMIIALRRTVRGVNRDCSQQFQTKCQFLHGNPAVLRGPSATFTSSTAHKHEHTHMRRPNTPLASHSSNCFFHLSGWNCPTVSSPIGELWHYSRTHVIILYMEFGI